MAEPRIHWLRVLGVLVFYAFLVYVGQMASEWALDRLEMDLSPAKQAIIHQMVLTAVGLYILLLALPFVPGVEIGLGLMVMLGPEICFLVYLSTVIALLFSFGTGRLVPTRTIVAAFEWVGLTRARDLVTRIAPLPADDRLALLLSHVPVRFLSFFLRHRYLALALILNLPGNAFIGGGGGIALAAGISRLFGPTAFLATVVLAVAPFPLIYFMLGGF